MYGDVIRSRLVSKKITDFPRILNRFEIIKRGGHLYLTKQFQYFKYMKLIENETFSQWIWMFPALVEFLKLGVAPN